MSYSKSYIFKFMQTHSWHHKLFLFRLSFWISEVWKRRQNITKKLEYLENGKSFLDEMKNIFHSFWRAIIWWKNKNLIKNSRHKLKQNQKFHSRKYAKWKYWFCNWYYIKLRKCICSNLQKNLQREGIVQLL